MQPQHRYWFPAKRYGWGWGIPSTWQGWPPAREPGSYVVYVAVLCALLIGVCWLKGEPPRWRWGNNE
jgi:hypothetical protein